MKIITYATFAVAIIGLIWIISCNDKSQNANSYTYEITYTNWEGDTIVRSFTAPHIEQVLETRPTLEIDQAAPCCSYVYTHLKYRSIIAIIGSEGQAQPWTDENANGYAVYEDGSYWGYDYICLVQRYRHFISLQKTGSAQ